MATDLKAILDNTAPAIASDPGLAAVRLTATCELAGVTEVDVRLGSQVIKADQPPVLGGRDAGPKPVEFALGSCQAMTYRFWSEKLGIRIDDIKVDIEGDLDVQGILGLRDRVRPGFADLNVNVSISGPEPHQRYEQLHQAVNSHCPVLDIFPAPVPVTTTMSVN
jgi:uncharacterized OsmC-like protein